MDFTAWDLISSITIGMLGIWVVIIVLAFAKHHDDKKNKQWPGKRANKW
jgi:hypothetical protein